MNSPPFDIGQPSSFLKQPNLLAAAEAAAAAAAAAAAVDSPVLTATGSSPATYSTFQPALALSSSSSFAGEENTTSNTTTKPQNQAWMPRCTFERTTTSSSASEQSPNTPREGTTEPRKRPCPSEKPRSAIKASERPGKLQKIIELDRRFGQSILPSSPLEKQTSASPPFFSHTSGLRPRLAPGAPSGEARQRIMKKEDSRGIRTVRMGRGSLATPDSPPPPGVKPAASQLPLVGSRGATPDDKESISGDLKALSQVGVLELLEQDDRPTFIIDIGLKIHLQPGTLHVSYANAALKAYNGLYDMIRGRTTAEDSPVPLNAVFPEYKAWITSCVKRPETMDVVLPSFMYAGITWSCSTIRDRFRVVTGTVPVGSVPVESAVPSTSTMGTQPRMMIEGVDPSQEEPSDYFGDAHAYISTSSDIPTTETKNAPLGWAEKPYKSTTETILLSSDMHRPTPPIRQSSPLGTLPTEATLRGAAVDASGYGETYEQGCFDWTRLQITPALPRHIQFARSVDWAATSLGPIEGWSLALRSTCNLMMASSHPAVMYWGHDLITIYNEPYILIAGQKHPTMMGLPCSIAWKEIWSNIKNSFIHTRLTGQSTVRDDDCLFINRSGFLEETYFSWSVIPLVGESGTVEGLYTPAFEKTRRKIAERRMLTLREVGEKTGAAREVKEFWNQVLKGLEYNDYDTPFVLLYSVNDDQDSDGSSIHSNGTAAAKQCTLEGTLPELPANHPAAPAVIDLKTGMEGFAPVFREAISADKPIILETANGTLDTTLIEGMAWRGFQEMPRAVVVCPIHPTTGETIIGFLVMGINPRRPYDDDYNLFVQLLTRQLATSMASVVLFEDEIRKGQHAAKLAALDRIELSEQLAIRTREAIENENKFTRMAEYAPVGMYIANAEGHMTFTNDTFHSITKLPKDDPTAQWMEMVHDDDQARVANAWDELVRRGELMTIEFRFKTVWTDSNGEMGDTWVLGSAYPEKYPDGRVKSIFGSLTNISQQKWAEDFQKRRTAEAEELKRQQSNFIDMTSHEMRNPLSAILQCADEISGSLLDFKARSNGQPMPASLVDDNIDAAQTISLCANHQTRIVSDVLTLSKLDSALLVVTPVETRPTTIVQQALKMFEGELQTADITMDFRIDLSVKRCKVEWVRIDPSRLLQVLINLTTNAIKFTSTQAKRTITITLSASLVPPPELASSCVSYIPSRSKRKDITEGKDWGSGDTVYLNFSVEDTGKGLTGDEMKLLFQRFQQASPKTHVQYGGSGLGLFISRELVELQGGEIGVSSESGKGSTFAFYVKARKSHGPNEGDQAPSPGRVRKSSVVRSTKPVLPSRPAKADDQALSTAVPAPLARLNVLIVEDNLVNQKVLSKQLRNVGCTVEVANHGEEGLAHLRKTKYWRGREEDGLDLSAILMDLEMPVMDGLTCTRRIRQLQKMGDVVRHVPIIAVSANARSAHIESALEAGMDDVVSKPFRLPELIPKIEQLVERYSVPTAIPLQTDSIAPAP